MCIDDIAGPTRQQGSLWYVKGISLPQNQQCHPKKKTNTKKKRLQLMSFRLSFSYRLNHNPSLHKAHGAFSALRRFPSCFGWAPRRQVQVPGGQTLHDPGLVPSGPPKSGGSTCGCLVLLVHRCFLEGLALVTD